MTTSEISSIISTMGTALTGLIGVLVGASLGPLINHQLTTRYSKKDLIFKRKLDYFEKVLDTIEKNMKLYKESVRKLEASKDNKVIKKILEEMKTERKNFLVMSSPLYFDVRKISGRIISFVKIEKDIFKRISSLKEMDEKEKNILTEQLKRMITILSRRGNLILLEMKQELKKY